MTKRASFVALVISALSSSGCCKACSAISGVAKEIAGPDAADGEKLVKERVEKDKELRKRICGLDTKELVDLVVKKDSIGNYSIQGTPIERPVATAVSSPVSSSKAAPAASASAAVDLKKTLQCAAVVSILWDAKEEPSGTKWSIQKLDVDQITTPGIEYKRPSADFD